MPLVSHTCSMSSTGRRFSGRPATRSKYLSEPCLSVLGVPSPFKADRHLSEIRSLFRHTLVLFAENLKSALKEIAFKLAG